MNDDRTLNHAHDTTPPFPEGSATDRTLDENLRAIGPMLGLPSAPSGTAAAKFRSGGTGTEPAAELRLAGERDSEGATSRRRPQRRWLAIGSAMAACVALGTVLFTMSAASRVEASTILNDLRQRQITGIDLDLNGIGAMGAAVDGTLKVRLKNPVTVDQLSDDQALERAGFGGLYAKLAVSTDGTVQELPNAQFGVEMAFSSDVGWVYLLADETTAHRIIDAEPRAAFLANMAQSGLLVNIGALDENLIHALGLDGEIHGMISNTEEDAQSSAESRGASIRMRQQAKIDIKGDLNDLTDEQVKSVNDAQEQFDKLTKQKHSKRLTIGATSDGKRVVKVVGIVTSADGQSDGLHIEGSNAAEVARIGNIETIARTMLSGTARQGELEQLKTILTQANTKATVQNLGGGEYELVADIRDDEAPKGQSAAARLTIRYQEDAGVQWAELSNMAAAQGSIRFSFASGPIDPALFNSQRLITVGQTNYLDLRSMLPMIKGALQGAPSDD